MSAGWHEVEARMVLSGDAGKLYVAWEGPELARQNLPAKRVACPDRTRMLIWRLVRNCELAQARIWADQLLLSVERLDKSLIEKLIDMSQVETPARPAVAAALARWLDYSIRRDSSVGAREKEEKPVLPAVFT